MIGGAAINRDFGRRIAFIDGSGFFDPGVFYAKDAFEGLEIMDRLDRCRPTTRALEFERTRRDEALAAACANARPGAVAGDGRSRARDA